MKSIAILLMLLVGGGAFAQTLSSERRKELRGILENDFAKQTENAVAEMLRLSKGGGTPEERQEAIKGVKSLMYNKAYNLYRCALLHPTSLSDAEECSSNANREMLVLFNLISSYSSLIAKRSLRCEMETRLFKAEIDFPPFSYMGEAHLFDHERMVECLRR